MRWEFPSWSKGTLGVLGVHQLEEQQPMRLRHVNYSILFNIFQNAGFWWLYLVNRGYKTCMCPISGYCLFIDSTLRYIWSMLPTFVVFLWIAQFRGLRTECETWGIPRNQPAAIQKIAYSTRIDKFFARHQAPPAQCGRCCCEASAWHGDLRWPSQALPPDLTGSCGASGLATAADDVGTAAQWRCVTCVGSMGIPWKILRWKQRRFRRCKFIARISGGHFFFWHQERHIRARHDMFGCYSFCSCFFFQKSQLGSIQLDFCLNVQIPSASLAVLRRSQVSKGTWTWRDRPGVECSSLRSCENGRAQCFSGRSATGYGRNPWGNGFNHPEQGLTNKDGNKLNSRIRIYFEYIILMCVFNLFITICNSFGYFGIFFEA